ncbi:hypothetical protein [Elongatibacter sediminis]|uniref:Uncharacterized protein n=1 Tax=Elongatibacter sediminis TaxID=3119006 RepID=A0AAW9RFC6_9GAMM
MSNQADRTPGARSLHSFTIATAGSAGIADTLSNTFALLHDLGRACGLEYVHTPLNFARSVTHSQLRAQRWLAVQAYLHCGTLRPFQSRLRTAHRHRPAATPKTACPINTFLGLNDFAPSIDDPALPRRRAVDVDIADLFRASRPRSLSDFRRALYERADIGDTPVPL